MKRRDFIFNSALIGSAMALTDALPFLANGFEKTLSSKTDSASKTKSILMVGHTDHHVQQNYEEKTVESVPGMIRIFDPQTGVLQVISSPAMPHGFCQSPTEPNLFAGIEKWTPRAFVLDFQKKSVIQTLEAPPSLRFFGHATFDSTGQTLFISSTRGKNAKSFVVAYDRKTWRLKQIIDIGGHGSHEITRHPDGKSLFIANYRPPHRLWSERTFPSEITVMSIADGTVTRRYPTPYCSHMLWIDSHTIALAGVELGSRGPLAAHLSSLDLSSGKVTEFNQTLYQGKPIAGETLSLARYDEDHIIATVTEANKLLFWNFRTNKLLIQDFDSEHLGVAECNGKFYLNQGSNGLLSKVRMGSDLLAEQMDATPVPIGRGRHLYSFKVPV